MNIMVSTFTFTTIQARPLYEAYVLGSVSIRELKNHDDDFVDDDRK